MRRINTYKYEVNMGQNTDLEDKVSRVVIKRELFESNSENNSFKSRKYLY